MVTQTCGMRISRSVHPHRSQSRADIQLITRALHSTRRRRQASGTISVQIGFLPASGLSQADASQKAKTVFEEMIRRGSAGPGGIGSVPAVGRWLCRS